ncbi:MAG: helicase-related protein, partial [Thermoplasmata archaeon]
EVYAKSLHEFYRGHEMTVGEWEEEESRVYRILDQYQKDGYRALMKIAKNYGGALLCDGVGLGKTYIGLMVIERLLHDRKKVALLVSKSARKPVWEDDLRRYLPDEYGDFSNLAIYNHTDLLREGEYQERMDKITRVVDAIVIDEAHHYRNQAAARSRKLFEMTEGKQVFLLTATPINNKLRDLQHVIELFSRKESDYFKEAPLGIHSLPGHFRKMENALEKVIDGNPYDAGGITLKEAEEVLSKDDLFRALVVQRSRAYVRQSQKQHRGREILFPERQLPEVVAYSLTKTYGTLLDRIERAMSRNRPLLRLGVYYPLAYYRGEDKEKEIDPLEEGRQKQVVGLIRTQLLKRFESSAVAFQSTCEALLIKLLAFVKKQEPRDSEHWQASHSDLIQRIREHQIERGAIEEEDFEEDVIPEELLESFKDLDPKQYDISKILKHTILDLDLLAKFLEELRDFSPRNDDKLRALVSLIKQNAKLRKQKVLIFSEYRDTARYLGRQLQDRGIGHLQQVDSTTKRDRGEIIKAFAPYYNKMSAADITRLGDEEIRMLVSTDVLSEGLNLQDASCIINYDLHWNPVRLMQRIGRVDRRLDRAIENRIAKDRPGQVDIPRKAYIWNFLPPDELDRLLNLYNRVSKKTLRISKVFGIEGKKLITPEDDYDALKDFNHAYEGEVTSTEQMFLEYQRLLKRHPDLADRLDNLPLKVFSGKAHLKEDSKAVFFCYSLPGPDTETGEWTREAGHCRWYLYDCQSGDVEEEPTAIIGLIRSTARTARKVSMPHKTLSEIRAKIEKHIKNTYFKRGQAPIGVKPTLMAWMELT